MFLSNKYGIDGFPLDYVLRLQLTNAPWHMLDACIPNRFQIPHRTIPDFFDFAQMDNHCCKWALIIMHDKKTKVAWATDHDLARYEDESDYGRTPIFLCDDEIVFHLASIAFNDSPGGCHFVSKKGVTHHGGCQAFFACKG